MKVAVPLDDTVGGHSPYFEAGVVLDGREGGWVGTAQSAEAIGRTIQIDPFVRSLVVVHRAERVEALLLFAKAASAVEGTALLEGSVHPFVAGVVFGMTRNDEHRLNAERHQTHAEGREPTEAMSTEGRAVVAEQGIRQAGSRKTASTSGHTRSSPIEGRAWQTSR